MELATEGEPSVPVKAKAEVGANAGVLNRAVAITYDGKLTGSEDLRHDNKFRISEFVKAIPPEHKSKIGEYAYLYDSAGKMGEPYFDAFLIMIAFLKDDIFDSQFAYYETKFDDKELNSVYPKNHENHLPFQGSELKTDLVVEKEVDGKKIFKSLGRSELGIVYQSAQHIFLMGPASQSCLDNISLIINSNPNVIVHVQGDANPSDPSTHTNLVSAPFMKEKEGMFPVAFNLWTGETFMFQIRQLCKKSYTVGLLETAKKFTYFRTVEEESLDQESMEAYNQMKDNYKEAFAAGVAANTTAKIMQEYRESLFKHETRKNHLHFLPVEVEKRKKMEIEGKDTSKLPKLPDVSEDLGDPPKFPDVSEKLGDPPKFPDVSELKDLTLNELFKAHVTKEWNKPCLIKPPYSEIIKARKEKNANWVEGYSPSIPIPVIPLVFNIGLNYIVEFILTKRKDSEQEQQHILNYLCNPIEVALICQDTFDKDNSVSLALALLLRQKPIDILILGRRVYNRENQVSLPATSPFTIVQKFLRNYYDISTDPGNKPYADLYRDYKEAEQNKQDAQQSTYAAQEEKNKAKADFQDGLVSQEVLKTAQMKLYAKRGTLDEAQAVVDHLSMLLSLTKGPHESGIVKFVRCCDYQEWQSPISVVSFDKDTKLPELSTNLSFNIDKTLKAHTLSIKNMGEMLKDTTSIDFNIISGSQEDSISDGTGDFAISRRCPFPEFFIPAISWWSEELSGSNFTTGEPPKTVKGGKALRRTRRRKYHMKKRKSNKYNL